MHVSEEDIERKKQELGLEPSDPSHGPETEVSDSLEALQTSEAAEAEQADLADRQQFRDAPGTNVNNQYR